MKKLLGTLPVLVLLLTLCPAWGVELPVQAEAALLMEKETGQVLYAKNEHRALEPASVTKVMTLLLVVEAIDDGRLGLDDLVTVSAHAASMGGSQVYLKEPWPMTTWSPSATMPPPWAAARSFCPPGSRSPWRTY